MGSPPDGDGEDRRAQVTPDLSTDILSAARLQATASPTPAHLVRPGTGLPVPARGAAGAGTPKCQHGLERPREKGEVEVRAPDVSSR